MEGKHNSVASMITQAMELKGIGIRELAEQLDLTYEHTRRIVRGEYTPNKFALKSLCDTLGVPFEEASKLALGERIRKKFGVSPDNLVVRVKGLEPIEKVWNQLSKAQQKDAISLVTSWAANNRGQEPTKGV